jgi:hypothetical protein
MADKLTGETSQGQAMADALKGWVMAALTLVFVALYGAALTGWLKPLPEEKMVTRLEPIIFVIIGYYFGRLPAQQNEKTLKDEIGRQTQKADAAQHAKEQAQQSREALEEKVKNARAALAPALPDYSPKGAVEAGAGKAGLLAQDESARGSISAALHILNT